MARELEEYQKAKNALKQLDYLLAEAHKVPDNEVWDISDGGEAKELLWTASVYVGRLWDDLARASRDVLDNAWKLGA